MPVLKLHFPEELVNKENMEDLLLEVNRDIQEEAKKFKSRASWMTMLLRNYALASVNSLRRWETTRYLPTKEGQPIYVPDLAFWVGDVEGLDDGAKGTEVELHIGKLQYTYLGKACVWENTYQREVLKSVVEHRTVAALARSIILNALLFAQSKIDEERLKAEEEEILKEEQAEAS